MDVLERLLGGIVAEPPVVAGVRIGTALVWFTFGIVYKLADLVPRHRAIVARVLGQPQSRLATRLIGTGEVLLGAWILSGVVPLACILAQTAAVAAMNALELAKARDLLLAPVPMVAANAVFLAAGWWAALAS